MRTRVSACLGGPGEQLQVLSLARQSALSVDGARALSVGRYNTYTRGLSSLVRNSALVFGAA